MRRISALPTGLLLALILAGGLLACDAGTPPAPSGPPATAAVPGRSPGPAATPRLPSATAVPAPPSATPVPRPTPSPTDSPVPAATQGPVRTPVGGAAGPEFMTAVAAMDAAPSYRYTLQLHLGAPAARYVLTGTGSYAPPAGYDTNFNALGFNSEILLLGPATYVRSYGVWRPATPGPLLYPMGAPPDVRAVLGLPSYALDAALVGDGNATLDGRPVRHFRFVLRAGGLLGPGDHLGTAGGDLWADAATHRFARLLYTFGQPGAPGDNDGTLQIDFRDYGVPVTLTAPPMP